MEEIESDIRLDALAVTINETDEALGTWETSAWFETQDQAAEAQEFLGRDGVVATIPERDWVRESLAGLGPVSAGRFFLHGSHDRALRRAGGISLEIDAGTAFGTGHHGTTWGCLVALDDIVKRERPARILDLGTGTGVLALAAARALRRPVMGTDIDPEAVRVARLNAFRNGVGPLFRSAVGAGLHHSSIREHAPYNLIFANILARPLVLLARGLCNLLAPGGKIILSGLTSDQLRWIKAHYGNMGLVSRRVIRNGNWIALVMERPSRHGKGRGSAPRPHHHLTGLGYAKDDLSD